MKVIWIILLFLALSLGGIFGKDQTLADSIAEAMKGLQPREAKAEAILERRNFEGLMFDQIISEIRSDPAEVLVVLANNTASDAEKTMALRLAQSLPANEYLELIATMLQNVEEGLIDQIYLNRSIRVSEKHLRGIWDKRNSSEYRKDLAIKLAVHYKGNEIYETFFKKVANNEILRPPLGSGAYSAKERAEARIKSKEHDKGSDPGAKRNAFQNEHDSNHRRQTSENQLKNQTQKAVLPKMQNYFLWIIAGLLLLGIFALLFKAWKGKSER